MRFGIRRSRALTPALLLLSLASVGAACGGAPDAGDPVRVDASKGGGASPHGQDLFSDIGDFLDDGWCALEYADPVHDAGLAILWAAKSAGAITSHSQCQNLVDAGQIAAAVVSFVTEDPVAADAIDGCSCDTVFSGSGGSAAPKPPATWHGWYDLGGNVQGRPGVLFFPTAMEDIYVRGSDDRLWQKSWIVNHWAPSDAGFWLHNDGVVLGSEPVLVGNASTRDVYARASDGSVIHKMWKNGAWSQWYGLGGNILGAPSVVVDGQFTDIYVRGADDALWQKYWNGTKWIPSDTGWIRHNDGAVLGSSPTVVSGSNFRDIYIRGTDGAVWHKVSNGVGGWTQWYNLGGDVVGEIGVAKPTATTTDIYVRGTDDALWQKWWDGKKWHPSDMGWVKHNDGVVLASSPTVVSWTPAFRDVFAVGPAGNVIHKTWH